jgi:hypothetical protein
MRDPTVTLWPDIFAPAALTVTIDRPTFRGPKPLDGREQVVASSAGGWLITYDGIPLYGDSHRLFRPLWATVGGFAKAVYVRPEFSPNMLAVRNNISPIPTGFSDAAKFSDMAQFIQSTGDCLLAVDAKRGDVTLSVTNSSVSVVAAGDYIEINGRLHVVQGMDGTTWTIWPPLRADHVAGTQLEIDDPRTLAYVSADARGLTQNIEFGRITRISIDFIEAGW